VAKLTIQLDASRRGVAPRELKDARIKFFNMNFKDVVRQVEGPREAQIIATMRSNINRAINAEMQRMKQTLVGNAGLVGSGQGRNFRIDPGEGPSGYAKGTPYDFTQVAWKPYSDDYSASKRRTHPANWKRWFLATGRLREELRSSNLWTAGQGLGASIKVIIRKRGRLGEAEIASVGRDLSAGQRGRVERLRLFDVKLRVFANLTSAELPYLASRNIYDVNSKGAILSKLGVSASIQEKLIPHSAKNGQPLVERYRPVFEPLLTYFMSQRIPAAVARVLYEPGGRGNSYDRTPRRGGV
jgi:hypothetical protein